MPRLRSPVSGSRVTMQGRVMKRPASRGQHFRMGRSSKVRGVGDVGGNSIWPVVGEDGGWRMEDGFFSDAAEAGASLKRWMMSLQGPELTIFGLAWRRSRAVPRSLMASRKPVGGLA